MTSANDDNMDPNAAWRMAGSRGEATLADGFEALQSVATVLKGRKRQRLVMGGQGEEHVYLVRRGLYFVHAPVNGDRSPILALLFPGDVVSSLALPPLIGASLSSAVDGAEIWRFRAQELADASRKAPALGIRLTRALNYKIADLMLHGGAFGTLTGEERVAALYYELALRLGRPSGVGHFFEMPLSRVDIADYLALNADTVSRIVSRLRSKGTVVPTGNGRILKCDLEQLRNECPLASALDASVRRETSDLVTLSK